MTARPSSKDGAVFLGSNEKGSILSNEEGCANGMHLGYQVQSLIYACNSKSSTQRLTRHEYFSSKVVEMNNKLVVESLLRP